MSLKHALLLTLSDHDQTGYEIAQWFDHGMGYFWHASHQQIYQELGKLAQSGLVQFEEVAQEGKPAKKIYHLNPSGMTELKQWLQKPATTTAIKDTLLMKVYAGHLLPPGHLLTEIETNQAGFRQLLAQFKQIERDYYTPLDALPKAQQYVYFTLRNGILYVEAWLQWADEFAAFLKRQ